MKRGTGLVVAGVVVLAFGVVLCVVGGLLTWTASRQVDRLSAAGSAKREVYEMARRGATRADIDTYLRLHLEGLNLQRYRVGEDETLYLVLPSSHPLEIPIDRGFRHEAERQAFPLPPVLADMIEVPDMYNVVLVLFSATGETVGYGWDGEGPERGEAFEARRRHLAREAYRER